MKSKFTGFLLLLATIWVGACAQAAQLDVGVMDAYAPVVREACARFVEKTGNQVRVHPYAHAKMMQFSQKGDMDVLIASCNRSGNIFEQKGYVTASTRKGLFCARMAVIVAPKNPLGIRGIEDLDRPDIKWGMIQFCTWRGEKLLAGKDEFFEEVSGNADTMMKLLAKGEVNAVLGWDYEVAGNPLNPVVMRIPISKYGSELAALVPAFVTKGSGAPKEAQELVDFLSKDPAATDLYLKQGYLLTDGVAKADSYDEGPATRYQKVYENICQQVIDDYGITKGNALDIGCGPGRMTLTLAKMTKLKVQGLDLEPEVIEIARHHAQEENLGERVQFVCADAHSLPYADNSFDLVICRGTLPFLRNQPLAMQEIYRVLKPGGVAFVGGGMGRYSPPETEKQLHGKDWKTWYGVDPAQNKDRIATSFPFPIMSFDALMTRAGIMNYKVSLEGGYWLEIRK